MPISAPDFLINPQHLNTADPEALRATVSPEAIAAAAGLAGLICAARDPVQRAALGLGPASDLLLIGREGAR